MQQANAFIAVRRARILGLWALLLLASTGGTPVHAEDGYDAAVPGTQGSSPRARIDAVTMGTYTHWRIADWVELPIGG